MSVKSIRLSQILKELNISLDRVKEFLALKGIEIDHDLSANAKITRQVYDTLLDAFQSDKSKKVASEKVAIKKKTEKDEIIAKEEEVIDTKQVKLKGVTEVGKIDLSQFEKTHKKTKEKEKEKGKEPHQVVPKEEVKPVKEKEESPIAPKAPKVVPEIPQYKTKFEKLRGLVKTGEVLDLDVFKKPVPEKKPADTEKKAAAPEPAGGGSSLAKKKRKRVSKYAKNEDFAKDQDKPSKGFKKNRVEVAELDVNKQIKETLGKLHTRGSKSKAAKYRKEKRDLHKQKTEEDIKQQEEEEKMLRVTEYVTVEEIASMMDVSPSDVISSCFSLGVMVTMNQRLDEDTLSLVAEEFGYKLEMASAISDLSTGPNFEEDLEENLEPCPPVVTIMGHVDHGKTSLLDYIRNENVVAGESGGITQHISAYSVVLADDKKITFVDTPGHQAYTAMRARGGRIANIVVLVIAADDSIKPQTEEAIAHCFAMGLKVIVAINKIDKDGANPDKVREALAAKNILVEDWGGSVQCQEISAKTGQGVDALLEKILLEAEVMGIKANPHRPAVGVVVDAGFDKGRGYRFTVIVTAGTLKVGDFILSGCCFGRVRALFNERIQNVKEASVSSAVSVIGLDEAPQAGDAFYVFEDEKEAKQIAAKRRQLLREQSVRAQRMVTLDEIGRRIAVGSFRELNFLMRGDVHGSLEALEDALKALSNEEAQVNIINKSVGPITESDISLAETTGAMIIGFNVKPNANIKVLAAQKGVMIKTFSIIYDAIDFVEYYIEELRKPSKEEIEIGEVEVKELFRISNKNTIAGGSVKSGKAIRKAIAKVFRDGEELFSGPIASLKHFKEDVKEVAKGSDCGVQVAGFEDFKPGDKIIFFEERVVKKKFY